VTETDGSGSVAGSHPYPTAGTYTVTVEVTDNDGGVGSDTLVVKVNPPDVQNQAPIANAGGPYSVDEGSSIALDGTGSSDPDGNPITYAWDLNNDGLYDDATGPTPSFAGVEQGVFQIGLQVSDGDLMDTAAAQVTVNNVAPLVNAGADQTITEGDTLNLPPASFSDPGVQDTHTATIVWGDGSAVESGAVTESNGSGTVAGGHTYVDNGTYTVTVTVTDDDGGVGSDTLTVTVQNAPPVVDAGPDQTITEGDTLSLAPATFTDAGVLDTHTATIDWGDGSAIESGAVTESNGSGSVAGSHPYPTAGTYTVTVTVTDNDGGVGSDSLTVTVEQAAVEPVQTVFDLFARPKDGKIDIVWTPVQGASGYNIYRSTTAGGQYTMIAAGHVTDYATYADFGLVNGTTYYYVVTSITNGVESLQSNEASGTPIARTR